MEPTNPKLSVCTLQDRFIIVVSSRYVKYTNLRGQQNRFNESFQYLNTYNLYNIVIIIIIKISNHK
jgi:hypothetical protein